MLALDSRSMAVSRVSLPMPQCGELDGCSIHFLILLDYPSVIVLSNVMSQNYQLSRVLVMNILTRLWNKPKADAQHFRLLIPPTPLSPVVSARCFA